MTPTNGSRTLADALNAGQSQPARDGGNPLIDRLATALAVKHAEDDFDDADEDLDLPMLVQGERYGAIVTTAPVQRMREGRAALDRIRSRAGAAGPDRRRDERPGYRGSPMPHARRHFHQQSKHNSCRQSAGLKQRAHPPLHSNPTASFTANVEEIVPAPKKETIAESFSPAPPPGQWPFKPRRRRSRWNPNSPTPAT